MSIKHRLNRLERLAKPEERTVFNVYVPHPDDPPEERERRERELAEAEARGERVYRIRIDHPGGFEI